MDYRVYILPVEIKTLQVHWRWILYHNKIKLNIWPIAKFSYLIHLWCEAKKPISAETQFLKVRHASNFIPDI